MRKLGIVLLVLVVIAGGSVAVYAWARNGRKSKDGLKEVEVATGTIVEKAVAVGQIQPRQKFQVKSKISGIVRRALVQVGDTVKAGDPLFEIAPIRRRWKSAKSIAASTPPAPRSEKPRPTISVRRNCRRAA